MRPAYPYDSTRLGIGALLSLLVPAAAMFIWRESWWPPVLFVCWTAGTAALYVLSERRRQRGQNVRMLDHARKSAIRTLSHHRHDWMNDLQIMYGYLRLNKPDKAAEIVDRIRERMENDSRVSQLGDAELATFLLSFRTMCDHLRLDVKVSDGLGAERFAPEPEKFTVALIGIINAVRYRAATPAAGENVLHVTFTRPENELKVVFEYEGEWTEGYSLAAEAANWLDGLGYLTEEEEQARPPGSSRRVVVTFPLTA